MILYQYQACLKYLQDIVEEAMPQKNNNLLQKGKVFGKIKEKVMFHKIVVHPVSTQKDI